MDEMETWIINQLDRRHPAIGGIRIEIGFSTLVGIWFNPSFQLVLCHLSTVLVLVTAILSSR